MKTELWLRLKRYHFDHLVPAHLTDRVRAAFGGGDASTQAFASKVARKLGWARPFTLQAIHEYKKFVYLGVVSDASVTPPKVIDQVWHEHLLFTRAYREFCRDVLGRDFDHNPELVQSKSQTDLFQAQYAETLAFYQAEFNREPPSEIWGTPKFKARDLANTARAPRRKSRDDRSVSSDSSPSYESDPLYMLFTGDVGSTGSSDSFHTGGGGGFSGGGSGGSWDSPSDGNSDSSHGGDSGSGSDGGGGDSGGSGCSSSCGGGGGD